MVCRRRLRKAEWQAQAKADCSGKVLVGMSYSVEIEGNRILNGARPDLPTVKVYDTADFTLEASPDLLGSVRLLADLFARQRTSLGFTFRARIDAGGRFSSITVEESGNFGLPGSNPR